MARDFISSGSTIFLSKASTPVTAVPCSIAAWMYVTTVGGNNQPLRIMDNATSNNDFSFYIDGVSHTIGESKSGGAAVSANGSVAVTTATWQHVVAVFATNSSRSVYLNGANKVTDVSSASGPLSLAIMRIGESCTHTAFAFNALWKVALSDADVLSLSLGASPRRVQPQNLVCYVRMENAYSPEPDLCSSTAWTVNGSPSAFANPRIYAP